MSEAANGQVKFASALYNFFALLRKRGLNTLLI